MVQVKMRGGREEKLRRKEGEKVIEASFKALDERGAV